MKQTQNTSTEGSQDVFDVVIVGAGLAGSLTAVALSQLGCRVALLDLHADPRPEFRAEQLVGPLVYRLADLGALRLMTAGQPLEPVTFDTRHGRIVKRTLVSQYGVPYQTMVRGARAALPRGVATLFGRVAACETGPDRQTVVLADETRVTARFLVLATGLSTVLPKRLGFSFRTVREGHSVALGFDIERLSDRTVPPPFVQHAGSLHDKLDYLAVFPMGNTIRANLFSYQDVGSPWVRQFCREPGPMLEACLPGLDNMLGPYRVLGPVQVRSNDLRIAENPSRDGVVLVGDAFQTPCPAAGTGIDRLLSDVAILAQYVPVWLASPGMAESKVARFYADADKRAADTEALRAAQYRRAVSTEHTVRWAFHRTHVALRRRLKAMAADAASGLWLGQPPSDTAALTP